MYLIVSEELVVYTVNERKQYYLHKNPKNLRQCLLRIYIFCYVWSFGGGLKVSTTRRKHIEHFPIDFQA
jgi:hypothetical protein